MNKKIEETTEEYERKEGSGLERAGAAAIFFLSPVLSYIMFELVTGNLAAVLPKNAVLNMVWMFALYLLVFGISGSSLDLHPCIFRDPLCDLSGGSLCRILQKPPDHDE